MLPSSDLLDFYRVDTRVKTKLHLFESGVSAGFPSPADDFADLSIDLNQTLIHNKSATFFAKVKGDSMKNAGIDEIIKVKS